MTTRTLVQSLSAARQTLNNFTFCHVFDVSACTFVTLEEQFDVSACTFVALEEQFDATEV